MYYMYIYIYIHYNILYLYIFINILYVYIHYNIGKFYPDYQDPAVRGMIVVDQGQLKWVRLFKKPK